MKNKHLLIIEDEKEIREMIELILKRNAYHVTSFSSCEYFWDDQNKYNTNYDLIILDWMLPGQSGVEFLNKIRQNEKWKSTPVLMITGKTDPSDVVLGLDTGADDFLIKPFDITVFLTRIKALLRRTQLSVEPHSINPSIITSVINRGDLTIRLESYEAFYKNKKLPLTPTEYKILVILLQHPSKIFTREHLVQYMHGEGINVIGRTIDTHIFALRRKLGSLDRLIVTERGIGYCYREQEDN